jgi:hypothetical protein
MDPVELLARRRLSDGFGAALLVARPVQSLIPSELVQIPPGEQAGVMAVIEHNLHGILTDRLHSSYADIFFTQHKHFLTRAMPFDFRRGRVHAQVLERQLEPAPVRKTHFQQPGFAAYFDFSRDRVSHISASIGPGL